MSRTRLSLVILLVALSAGCGWRKQHLIENYGGAYDEVFAAQAGPPRPATKAVSGLDSQEAAIVADTYRKSLAPQGERARDEPVIILQPQQRNERRELPPPSVPKS